MQKAGQSWRACQKINKNMGGLTILRIFNLLDYPLIPASIFYLLFTIFYLYEAKISA